MFKSCQTKFVRVMAVLAIVMVFASMSFAQSTVSGAITGTVTDASGAVVPNAKVEITNTGTNATTSTTSNEAGNFRADNLQPGTYDVKVTAANFSDYKATRLIVEVGRVSNVDAKLAVSGQGETVEVRDEAPMVNTERQDFANNIDQTQIQNLPINGRRWSNYALLTPTANPDGNFGLISFRGISGLLNNSTVDGGDNNSNFYGEERGRTRLSYSTSQDSIQEFQVNTSNFSAEYGRSAGGVVNTITKSGSNNFHGSAYWFIRDNTLGATNPGSRLNNLPYKAPDRRDQFGATLGGPIFKDRAFFFFNYDQQKRDFPGVAVPIATTGTNPYGPVTVTSATCPAGGATTGLNLGQVIFCRFGSVAAGQAAANAGFNFITSLLGTNDRKGDQLIFFPKVDLKVLGGNWATSYNWLNWTSPAGIQTGPTISRAKDAFGDDLVRTRTLNSIFNRALGGRASMELRFHWSSENLSGDWQELLPGQPTVNGVTGAHPPGVFITNWLQYGTPDYLPRPSNPKETQYQTSGNLLFGLGKHTLKIGGDYLYQVEDVQSLFEAYGTYNYTGTFAYADWLSDVYNAGSNSFTGSGLERCFTSGVSRPCYSSFTQSVGTLGYSFNTRDYAFFIQDDWKIHPRLNLNLGVRYEYQSFPEPQFPNPLLAQTSVRPEDRNNFGPRAGFAWNTMGNGKLVFRGGWGMYYARVINSTIASYLTNTGVASAQPRYTVANTTQIGANNLLYPNILSSAAGLTLPAPSVAIFQPGFETPHIYMSDAVMEYEFAKNTVLSVSYLNSMGRNLINFLDINLPTTRPATNTFTLPGSGASFTVPSYGTQARPNTNFNQIGQITNAVDSDYNAMVIQVMRRMTNGFQMQSSYTFSKATDNGQVSQTFVPSNLNQTFDPLQPELEFGRSNFDVPHKFVLSAVWQPNYFKDENRFAHHLFDGWTLAPIVTISSGTPYTGSISGTLSNSSTVGATGVACLNTHSGGLNCASGLSRVPTIEKNTFRSRNRKLWDMRVSRTFGIRERMGLEFIAEAFNVLNRANVTSTNTGQYSLGTCTVAAGTNNATCPLTANSAFGTPTTTGINNGTNFRERQVQFAVRFKF